MAATPVPAAATVLASTAVLAAAAMFRTARGWMPPAARWCMAVARVGTAARRRADVIVPAAPTPATAAIAAGVVVVAAITDIPAAAIAGSDSDCAGRE